VPKKETKIHQTASTDLLVHIETSLLQAYVLVTKYITFSVLTFL